MAAVTITSASAFPEENLALVQAAHEGPEVPSLLEEYKQAELADDHIWAPKDVKPDEPELILDTDDSSVFGANNHTFALSFGPIQIKAIVDPTKLDISYSVAINYFQGTKELISVNGNLVDGAKGEINARIVKGTTIFFLRNDREVWLKLDLSGPILSTIDKEVKVMRLCESDQQADT